MKTLYDRKRERGFKYINYKCNWRPIIGTWGSCQSYEVVEITGKRGLIVRAIWSGKLLKMSLRVNGSYQFVGCPTYEDGVGYASDTRIDF